MGQRHTKILKNGEQLIKEMKVKEQKTATHTPLKTKKWGEGNKSASIAQLTVAFLQTVGEELATLVVDVGTQGLDAVHGGPHHTHRLLDHVYRLLPTEF